MGYHIWKNAYGYMILNSMYEEVYQATTWQEALDARRELNSP